MPATSKKSAKSAKSGQTKSQKAGLLIPVARVEKAMRTNGIRRISEESKVLLGAAVQFYLELFISNSIQEVDKKNKQRIMPEHIQLAIRDNKELSNLLKGASVAHTKMQGWILDNASPSNKKSKKSKKNKKKALEEAATPPASPKKAAKAPGAPKKAKKVKA